jgi:LmeA-like phospholipid-binding
METITIFLSALFGLLSTAGIFVDRIARNVIVSQFNRVEQLQVRVDNVPTYQLVQGKVERVRIAGRGLWLTPEARIAAVEVETDPLDVNIQQLRRGGQQRPTAALRKPLQAGVRLVLSEADLNKTLQSPSVKAQLQNLVNRSLGGFLGGGQTYELVNPQIEFTDKNRIRFQVELRQQGASQTPQTEEKKLAIAVESGIAIVAGRRFQLVDPSASIDNNEIPGFLLGPLTDNLTQQLDLGQLEKSAGITARLLQLKVNPDQMEIAAFVRVQPSTTAPTEKP